MDYSNGPPLSLETFDPGEAKAPFLTTPRSLEACRRLGVRPVELVELSVHEFTKEFPNDPIAAQKRYERIEGARRTLYDDVKTEWKSLVESGWRPNKHRPATSSSARETIIPITPQIGHSTLLELQAEEFRRIEQGEWNKLQRVLYMNVKTAEDEQRMNKIVQKHEEIANSNASFQRELAEKKRRALQEQLERQRQKAADEERALKVYQRKCMEEHKVQKIIEEEKVHNEKLLREKIEKDRLDREEYTRTLKNSIVAKINDGIRLKEKTLLEKEEEALERTKIEAEAKRRDLKEKADQLSEKIAQTRVKILTSDEKRREELQEALRKDDLKRKEILEEQERERIKAVLGEQSTIKGVPLSTLRSQAIIQKKKEIETNFKDKAKFDLDVKDRAAQHELYKVRNLLDERKLQKSIRQEAHDICRIRKEKALQYKEEQIKIVVEDKNKRSEAIKVGYIQLKKMKVAMKDIMTKATHDLKENMASLQKQGQFHPDNVIQHALNLSENHLFPTLQKTFGITPKGENLNSTSISSGLPSSSLERPTTAPNARKNKIAEIESAFGRSSAAGVNSSAVQKDTTSNRPVSPGADPNARVLQSTLPLQLFEKDALVSSLNNTKVKVARNNLLETKERKPGDYSKKSAKNKNSTMIDKSLLTEEDDGPDVDVPIDDGEVFYSFSYNNQDHDNLSLSYKPDGSSNLKSTSKESVGRQQRVKSAKARFTPAKDNEFRREFSSDHPLVGGTGKYLQEQSEGLKPASGARTEKEIVLDTLVRPVREKLESKYFDDLSSDINDLSKKAFNDIEVLKRRQNEYMLNVIDEERTAEEYREKVLKEFNAHNKHKIEGKHELTERAKLENIFTEQRQRASERIMKLTKEHDANIRDVVLNALIKENKR